MHFCKKISVFIGLFCLMTAVYAADSHLDVESADLYTVEGAYVLDAAFNIELDTVLSEAVDKGIELPFIIEFQIVQPRKYWFDDEIVTVRKQITLSYHALSRQYLVVDGAYQQSFEGLSDALQQLQQIKSWLVVPTAALEAEEVYQAALLIRLDKSKLPKAIQVDAIASEAWDLSSDIYRWDIEQAVSEETTD